MSDAQMGLSVAAPLIIVFAVFLHRMRALSLAGTIAASAASVAIATALFFTQ